MIHHIKQSTTYFNTYTLRSAQNTSIDMVWTILYRYLQYYILQWFDVPIIQIIIYYAVSIMCLYNITMYSIIL